MVFYVSTFIGVLEYLCIFYVTPAFLNIIVPAQLVPTNWLLLMSFSTIFHYYLLEKGEWMFSFFSPENGNTVTFPETDLIWCIKNEMCYDR
ncbi:hypothetical protein ACE6H2_019739 [Prunus campanulata]